MSSSSTTSANVSVPRVGIDPLLVGVGGDGAVADPPGAVAGTRLVASRRVRRAQDVDLRVAQFALARACRRLHRQHESTCSMWFCITSLSAPAPS